MAFHIIRNDIVKMKVDAIVNSANPKPTYAYGTDLAIYKAAGAEALLKERLAIGEILPGTAAVTSAGNLQAKYIIHTVGPSWIDGSHGEFDVLRACYANVLEAAERLKCRSIAFPLIATGVYGFPKDQALKIAMSAIQSYLIRHEMDVYLVVFDENAFVLSGKVFDRIQAYVDANYVADAYSDEYRIPEGEEEPDMDTLRLEALRKLDSKAKPLRVSRRQSVKGRPKTEDWNVLFDVDEKTFQEKLFEYIDRSGLKSSDIYRPIEMSRQQYSKILCNKHYQPKKNTALLLCIVLKLSLAEAEDLLSRAGLAFNPSSKQDVIVKACLLQKQYDISFIDAVMQMNHLDSLIRYDGK